MLIFSPEYDDTQLSCDDAKYHHHHHLHHHHQSHQFLIMMMIFMMQRSGSLSSLCGDGLGLLDHPFLLQYDTSQYPPSELVIIIHQYDTKQYPPSELVLC